MLIKRYKGRFKIEIIGWSIWLELALRLKEESDSGIWENIEITEGELG